MSDYVGFTPDPEAEEERDPVAYWFGAGWILCLLVWGTFIYISNH